MNWFLIFLDNRVYNHFDIKHKEKNNYTLVYKNKTKVECAFLVVRTSKFCFRMMVYQKLKNNIYLSFKSARLCAQFVNDFYFNIFLKDINNRNG